MFKDIFKVINRKYNLNIKFNGIDLTGTFPNGSILYCIGMDSTEKEQEKALGQKNKLVVIDECASFRQSLYDIVHGIFKPTVGDYDGTICTIGSTSSRANGYFFEITQEKKHPEWDVHKWGWEDNPHVKNNIQKQVDRMIADSPSIVETPLFRQMYMNEWVVDEDRLVYKFNPERNLTVEETGVGWEYVLGIDLGYEDDTAFVVGAYHKHNPVLRIIKTYKKKKMDLTDVADQIKFFRNEYTPTIKMVIDGANKQAVQEMVRRHGLPLEPTDKVGKSDFIEIMNAELIQGKIKLVEDQTTDLQDEWQTLIWDDKASKRVENPSCPNHLSDAALYMWRYCYSYLARPEIVKPHPTSEEAVDDFWEDEVYKAENKKEIPFWEQEI